MSINEQAIMRGLTDSSQYGDPSKFRWNPVQTWNRSPKGHRYQNRWSDKSLSISGGCVLEPLDEDERHYGSDNEKIGHVGVSIVSAIREAVELYMLVRVQIVREIMELV